LRRVPGGRKIADMEPSIPVPRLELRRLGNELAEALRAVTQARAATDPFEVLSQLTAAIEGLSATQHELVNVLLDHGHSWSEIGEGLSTSAAAADAIRAGIAGKRKPPTSAPALDAAPDLVGRSADSP